MITTPFGVLATRLGAAALLPLLLQTGCARVDLSPAAWGQAELARYVRTERTVEPISRASTGMVTGTSSPIAIRAGLEALLQGGSAVDAALATALTHITLAGGCTVSFAGVMTLVYYDASTGEVFALDGGYNTVLGEDDPLGIPRSSPSDPSQGSGAVPKGRTVLVPGFMAGLGAAHARFGKLPLEEVFAPAIYFAEEGFPISARLAELVTQNREVLSRLPETRSVFLKEDGTLYAPGELFRQPELARTLEGIAEQGTESLYRGAWADELVEAVRRDGGKLTREDLRRYQPTWHDPIHVSYRGHDVYLPSGGVQVAGMLNLLEHSNLAEQGYYAESAESLFWFCRIIQAVSFGTGLDGTTIRREDWVDRERTAQIWGQLRQGSAPGVEAREGNKDPSNHSDAVVVVDQEGNVAALLHSSNTVAFGESGLYIGGVSIPDSATFQQAALSMTLPGTRLFNPTIPLVVLRDGRPVLGLSAIGSGIYEESVKCLLNILGHGRSVQEAIDAPTVVPTFGQQVDSPSVAIGVSEEDYGADLLESARGMGLDIEVLTAAQARRRKGAAAAIKVDPVTGMREGGSVRRFSLGYSSPRATRR